MRVSTVSGVMICSGIFWLKPGVFSCPSAAAIARFAASATTGRTDVHSVCIVREWCGFRRGWLWGSRSSRLFGEDYLPIVFHAHDGPTARLCFIEALIQPANVRLA